MLDEAGAFAQVALEDGLWTDAIASSADAIQSILKRQAAFGDKIVHDYSG